MRGRARLAATLELLAARQREKSAAGQAAQAWPAWSRLWALRPAGDRAAPAGKQAAPAQRAPVAAASQAGRAFGG